MITRTPRSNSSYSFDDNDPYRSYVCSVYFILRGATYYKMNTHGPDIIEHPSLIYKFS